jgi:hypothetical protein
VNLHQHLIIAGHWPFDFIELKDIRRTILWQYNGFHLFPPFWLDQQRPL